jgi:hypothetical protein
MCEVRTAYGTRYRACGILAAHTGHTDQVSESGRAALRSKQAAQPPGPRVLVINGQEIGRRPTEIVDGFVVVSSHHLLVVLGSFATSFAGDQTPVKLCCG